MQEAMLQVKNALGRDAIILNTRTFRKGGVFGFFTKEKVEVMAAIDPPVPTVIEKPVQTPVEATPLVVPPLPSVEKTRMLPLIEENKNLVAVQHELMNMRTLLEQVLSKESPEVKKSVVLESLLNNDIELHIAKQMIKSIPAQGVDDRVISLEVEEKILEQIKEKLQVVEGIEIPKTGRKIVAFIGPTGVGKTTTIAKLAAKFAIQDKCSVALITADTYRVSAVEQLKTYSDIMGIPIYVVYTADELKRILDANQDKQLILIDTAGRSPHNHDQLEELEKLLKIDDTIEKHLVLSATTKYKDALDIVEKFSRCAPYKVLFTKIDEARNIGTIINLLYQIPISLSYMTNGQNVPDDIELVDAQKLKQLIFRNQ